MYVTSSLSLVYMHLNSLIHSFVLHIAQVLEQVTPKFDLALCPTAVQNEAKNRSMDCVPSTCSYSYIVYPPPSPSLKNREQPGDKAIILLCIQYKQRQL